jgi:hypothetical protein
MCEKFTQMASWREVRDFVDMFSAADGDVLEMMTPIRRRH